MKSLKIYSFFLKTNSKYT